MRARLIGIGVLSVLGVLPCSGCPAPSITTPDGAIGDHEAAPESGSFYRGASEVPILDAEVKLPEAERWREWKRDPQLLRVGAEQHLYLAGSPAPPAGVERWSIGRAVAAAGQAVTTGARFEQIAAARPGFWDGGDLLSPAALPAYQGAGGATAVWYAASGDPQKPDYVFQIGLLTSTDGRTWERRPRPVLAAPAFTGSGADGRPMGEGHDGPTSHGLLDPTVLPVAGSTIWLYFAGVSCTERCRFQILRTVSTDGVNFQPPQVVLRGRDGVPEEGGGVAGPSVLLREGRFYLAYTQVREPVERSRQGIRRALITGSLALAESGDGITFESASGPRPLLPVNRGFFAGGSFSPGIYVEGGQLMLHFAALVSLQEPAFSVGRLVLLR